MPMPKHKYEELKRKTLAWIERRGHTPESMRQEMVEAFRHSEYDPKMTPELIAEDKEEAERLEALPIEDFINERIYARARLTDVSGYRVYDKHGNHVATLE